MSRINILGSGADVLSMMLETLAANNQIDCEVIVFQNIPNTLSHNDYLPKGMTAKISAYNDLKVNDGKYLFGVMNSKVKPVIFDFFNDYLNIERTDYTNLIHNRSWVASSASLQRGIYIEPLSIISPFAEIGFGVSINRNVSIGHHTKIKDFATIAPGVNIGGHSVIEEKVQVGIGSTVFDQVRIGANSIIGGGSVVVKDIPANSIAYGNPCKVIRTIK